MKIQAPGPGIVLVLSPLQPARGELLVFDWEYSYHDVDNFPSFWQRVSQTKHSKFTGLLPFDFRPLASQALTSRGTFTFTLIL